MSPSQYGDDRIQIDQGGKFYIDYFPGFKILTIDATIRVTHPELRKTIASSQFHYINGSSNIEGFQTISDLNLDDFYVRSYCEGIIASFEFVIQGDFTYVISVSNPTSEGMILVLSRLETKDSINSYEPDGYPVRAFRSAIVL